MPIASRKRCRPSPAVQLKPKQFVVETTFENLWVMPAAPGWRSWQHKLEYAKDSETGE